MWTRGNLYTSHAEVNNTLKVWNVNKGREEAKHLPSGKSNTVTQGKVMYINREKLAFVSILQDWGIIQMCLLHVPHSSCHAFNWQFCEDNPPKYLCIGRFYGHAESLMTFLMFTECMWNCYMVGFNALSVFVKSQFVT